MASQIKAYASMHKSGPCVPWTYAPMPMGPHDVDIKITHCGVCHSDVHEIDSGWPTPTTFPLVPGHEVIGHISAKGGAVTKFKLGDRVGLGPQCYACFEKDCVACSVGQDCCCPKRVFTYDCKYPNGFQTYGGYAEALRTHDSLVVKIPDALPSDAAAPLLCAGITVYSPLVENGVKQGSKVGVIGLGGLGHLAVQFASKMGAEVTVLSRTPAKKADATKFGAQHFLLTTDAAQMKAAERSFEFLVVTASGSGQNWSELLKLVKVCGTLMLLALPEDEVHFFPSDLTANKIKVMGSLLAPLKITEDMLEFCAKHTVLPLIEKLPMSKVNDAIAKVRSGNVHYRCVLEA